MRNGRGVSPFILTLSFIALIVTACETQQERTGVGEATPSPTARMTPAGSPAASPQGSPATGATGAVSMADRDFMMNAARGSMSEVQLGNLAAQKGSSDEVKQFGQRMAADHSQLGQTLRQMATNMNVTLPQDLDTHQQEEVSHLEKLSGKAFDREYVKMMVRDHAKDISEYERASKEAANSEIKQYASQALPTLREHQKMARDLAAKLGVKTG